MRSKILATAVALGAALTAVVVTPSVAFADSDPTTCNGTTSCRIGGLYLSGPTDNAYSVDIVADGPANSAVVIQWSITRDANGASPCHDVGALDANGHLAHSYLSTIRPSDGDGPFTLQASTDVPVNWRIGLH